MHIPAAARRRIGLRIAFMLDVPVNWPTLAAMRPREAGIAAARAGNARGLRRAVQSGGEALLESRCRFEGRRWRWMSAILMVTASSDNPRALQALCEQVAALNSNSLEMRLRSVLRKALMRAADCGSVGCVQYLLELPASYRLSAAVAGTAALLRAAKIGSTEVVRYLCGLQATRPGKEDSRALQVAASHGHLEVVQLMLSLPLHRGVRVYHNDYNAVRQAVMHGHAEVLAYLVKAEAQWQSTVDGGPEEAVTDVEAAAGIASVTHGRGAGEGAGAGGGGVTGGGGDNNDGDVAYDATRPNKAADVALCMAASLCKPELLRVLIDLPPECRVSPGVNDNAALTAAIRAGSTQCVRLLCRLPPRFGVRPSATSVNSTAVASAAAAGQKELVEEVVDFANRWGVDMYPVSVAAAMGAAQSGSSELVAFLYKRFPPRPEDLNAALRLAATYGHLQVLKECVAAATALGIPIDANGALFASSEYGQDAKGVPIDRDGRELVTARGAPVPAQGGRSQVIQYLFSLGVDPGTHYARSAERLVAASTRESVAADSHRAELAMIAAARERDARA